MTRHIYFVREKFSGAWCYSSKGSFSSDFEYAVIFLREENAAKAVKEMTKGLDPKYSTFPNWRLDGEDYSGTPEALEHFRKIEAQSSRRDFVVPELRLCEFEVVKFAVVEA